MTASTEYPSDDRLAVQWIQSQPESKQAQIAADQLAALLKDAAQPRHASGNACIKLCFFIEQCQKAESAILRDIVFSEKVCLNLFNFYLEWNESNQHRSMRQVLEVQAALIIKNPNPITSRAVISLICQRTLQIISHQASLPLVKPAFKSLEFYVGKGVISFHDLILGQTELNKASASRSGSNDIAISSLDNLISEGFDWMTLQDVAPAAGKFLVTLFRELRRATATPEDGSKNYMERWQDWIRRALSKHPDSLENIKYYLFPPLFKIDRAGSLAFLEDLNTRRPTSGLQGQELDASSLLYLAAIDVGKKVGLVEEPSTLPTQKTSKKAAQHVILDEVSIGKLMTHPTDTVRSLAFSVLASSSSGIRPFSSEALRLMQNNMETLYADTDAKFRNDVLSNTKHMIERLRGATAFLTRELERLSFGAKTNSSGKTTSPDPVQQGLDALSTSLQSHKAFLEWYIDFLLGELISTASYQRHITALKAIHMLVNSGIQGRGPAIPQTAGHNTTWPTCTQFFTPHSIRLLLDLLLDPFEDVRVNLTAVLKLASKEDFNPVAEEAPEVEELNEDGQSLAGHRPLGILLDFIERAKSDSERTGRADYADGVARSYEILYHFSDSTARTGLIGRLLNELENKIRIAENDLSQAVLSAPVHNNFGSLSLVWESIDNESTFLGEDAVIWLKLQLRMRSCCLRIWEVTKEVLCDDAPEGHVLDDADETEIDTKDVLSYSFRAIHESSNLMRTMMSKVRSKWGDGSPVVSAEIFSSLGDLAFTQLSNLRHRGAFSTVTLTFARCCQLSQYAPSGDESQPTTLARWYQGSLKCIAEQASTTRRSAGIPALVTGILAANSQNPTFQEVMEELKSLARQPVTLTNTDATNLPQVHAINCLKEIFKSSTLKRSESHIADCLQLAADSLNSDTWAIRNCGLLLLRSLVDNLFGTTESKGVTEAGWDGRSMKLSWEQYPDFPELLLKLLHSDSSGSGELTTPTIGAVESVFPALDIIRRAGPPIALRAEIETGVSIHLSSKVWHIRELAARTWSTFMLHDDWLLGVLALIHTSDGMMNRIHGILMAVKFVLDRRLALLPNPAAVTDLVSILKACEEAWPLNIDQCAEAMSAYIEIEISVSKTLIASGFECPSDLKLFNDSFFRHTASEFSSSSFSTSSALYNNAMFQHGLHEVALLKMDQALPYIINTATAVSVDVVLSTLEELEKLWAITKTPNIQIVSDIYVSAIVGCASAEVRSRALEGLALAHEKWASCAVEYVPVFNISKLWQEIDAGKGSPRLSNAKIRISGSLMLDEVITSKSSGVVETGTGKAWNLESWGMMLRGAGHVDLDFDTRHAAAAALNAFYSSPWTVKFDWNSDFLPSMLALYDTLNDDDDEIRDLGASIASSILKTPLVPLAAQSALAEWIRSRFGGLSQTSWSVICRVTGNENLVFDKNALLKSAEAQLITALKPDDALFVKEEQNLFVDEVRETKLWSKIFVKSLGNITDCSGNQHWLAASYKLANWVLKGLCAMSVLAGKVDGPLGWTSKPDVFASCTRVLVCANSLLESHFPVERLEQHFLGDSAAAEGRLTWEETQALIIEGLSTFAALGTKNSVHQSLLALAPGP